MQDLMRQSYPHLFPSKSNFRGQKFYKVGGCKTRGIKIIK